MCSFLLYKYQDLSVSFDFFYTDNSTIGGKDAKKSTRLKSINVILVLQKGALN